MCDLAENNLIYIIIGGFPNIFYLCELMVPSISCDAVTLDENFKPRYCERSHFIEKNVLLCYAYIISISVVAMQTFKLPIERQKRMMFYLY